MSDEIQNIEKQPEEKENNSSEIEEVTLNIYKAGLMWRQKLDFCGFCFLILMVWCAIRWIKYGINYSQVALYLLFIIGEFVLSPLIFAPFLAFNKKKKTLYTGRYLLSTFFSKTKYDQSEEIEVEHLTKVSRNIVDIKDADIKLQKEKHGSEVSFAKGKYVVFILKADRMIKIANKKYQNLNNGHMEIWVLENKAQEVEKLILMALKACGKESLQIERSDTVIECKDFSNENS